MVEDSSSVAAPAASAAAEGAAADLVGGTSSQAAAAASSAAAAAASSASEQASSTLESLSDLYIRALYVCRVGSQTAFAFSPVAAYLPQYLAMRGQCEAANSHSHGSPSPPTAAAHSSRSSSHGGGAGGSSNLQHRRGGTEPVSPQSGGKPIHDLLAPLPQTPPPKSNGSIGGAAAGGDWYSSPPQEAPLRDGAAGSATSTGAGVSDGGGEGGGGGGGGMSPISMLILLLSHLLRLLYFYGHHVWLRGLPTYSGPSGEDEEVQYDLVVQSVVMIAVQLLLVNAAARIRFVRDKRRMDDHDHSDVTMGGRGCLSLGRSLSLGKGSRLDSASRSIRFMPLSVLKRLLSRVSYILHPRRVWRYNTLREHVEFLVLCMTATAGYCRLSLFPRLGGDGVDRVRNVSVLLESCLALPQVVQNYLRRETAGLSLVMVVGWIVGDWMKLLYFMLQSPGGGDTTSDAAVAAVGGPVAHTAAAAVAGAAVPGAGGSSGATLRVFALGCLVALTLDVWVLLQLVLWYPTRQMMTMRAKVGETWDRFGDKPNNDVVGRKRAVARELIGVLFGSTDKAPPSSSLSQQQLPRRRKHTDEDVASSSSIQVADGSSNWS